MPAPTMAQTSEVVTSTALDLICSSFMTGAFQAGGSTGTLSA